MSLTSDQKKHLLIGGGLGALVIFVGSALLGGGPAYGGSALPRGHGHDDHDEHDHDKPSHDKHHGHEHGHDDDHDENDRGEYGPSRKHRREHGHG